MTNDLRFPLILNPEIDEYGRELRLNFQPKHIDIIREIMRPENDSKLIDVLCGIGFGKTTTAILVATAVMELYPESRIMFLEPDADKLDTVFWAEWEKWIPRGVYSVKTVHSKKQIHWHNGAILYPRHRWASGNSSTAADIMRGPNLTLIIDDEAAIKFNMELYKNGLGRLRVPCPVSGYITWTTPKVGPYGDLITMPGHRLFHGRTIDNAANHKEGFEAQLRSQMSEMHARRELDGEMVALEGRVWQSWDDVLNMSDYRFMPRKPFCLAGDIGVVSAWLIIQRYDNEDVIVGQVLSDEGGTKQDMTIVARNFGRPVKVITGSDLNSRSQVSGTTAAFEIKTAMQSAGLTSNLPFFTPSMMDTAYTDKGIQFFAMDTLIEKRRLKLSRHCMIIGNENRSFIKMIQQDAWPDNGKTSAWFVKDKKSGNESPIEDVRDAALYYSVCEHPPRIGHKAA